jgi:hypothetical protein
VALCLRRNEWPARWQEALALAHRSDWLNTTSPGYLKAHGLAGGVEGKSEKNAGGETVAQMIYRLDQEIADLEEKIPGFETTQRELADELEEQVKKLRAERAKLA